MLFSVNDITVTKIEFVRKENSKVVAVASIRLFDFIDINGYKITPSKFAIEGRVQNLYVAPPSYRRDGRYHDVVFIDDAKSWDAICETIIKAFNEIPVEKELGTLSFNPKQNY